MLMWTMELELVDHNNFVRVPGADYPLPDLLELLDGVTVLRRPDLPQPLAVDTGDEEPMDRLVEPVPLDLVDLPRLQPVAVPTARLDLHPVEDGPEVFLSEDQTHLSHLAR